MLHRNGKIYLTFSASDTSAAYCMGMLEAGEGADLLDRASWTKSRYPVLASNEELGLYGPGHNSFTVDDEDGSTVCVFHARTGKNTTGNPWYDGARHAYCLHVQFDENGRPIFTPDVHGNSRQNHMIIEKTGDEQNGKESGTECVPG